MNKSIKRMVEDIDKEMLRLELKKEILLEMDQKEPTKEKSEIKTCLLYTSPSPRDRTRSRMPSSA